MNLADGASIKDNKKDDYMNQVLQLMDRFSDSDMTKLQVEVEGFKVSLQRETKEMIEVAHAGQLKTVDMVPINCVCQS